MGFAKTVKKKGIRLKKMKTKYSSLLLIATLAVCLTSIPVQANYTGNPDSNNKIPARYNSVERIVAIGDLHGDLKATKKALILAGVIDNTDHWTGKKTVVVQTGDQTDRGNAEKEVIDLFEQLSKEAKLAGGNLLPLNGNHEIMNVNLDFRYVSPEGFESFKNIKGINLKDPAIANINDLIRPRAAAFKPGGPYAKILAKRNIITVIGDVLFVHGGVIPKYAEYGIEKMNSEAQSWMRGERKIPDFLISEDGPVWNRIYADETRLDCNMLEQTLNKTRTKYMVVGHTIQRNGITSECNEKVWRIDTGMSYALFNGSVQVLEIKNNKFRIISFKKK